MFRVESYITPILLSYVDKYIKNFRPEDSQVSLWGGDASFHNLDLRLEVLEEELQLPFSFVSGHIHELQIHVPWTKITSEPISITINTIECILKLRGDDSTDSDAVSPHSAGSDSSRDIRKRSSRKQVVEAPPGYVQSLVNRVVSNITILCNNLILKYVEEDIVLSVNVKTLGIYSANNKWEPAFTDLSSSYMVFRKLVQLSDLTVCLDKRNASGKIELYQEPLLYRCSLEIHFLRNYLNINRKRSSVTRIDVKCGQMDFGLTEQQIPMLKRLMLLALALHRKELDPEKSHDNESIHSDHSSEQELDEVTEEGWFDWAWSFVPAMISTRDDDISLYPQAYFGNTLRTGFFVERITISFKSTELTNDKSYYGPRKARFVPFLAAQLQGCFMDCTFHSSCWTNIQMGISHATLCPVGYCPCNVEDADVTNSNVPSQVYLQAGNSRQNYITDSLFDSDAIENKDGRRLYSVSWENHISLYSEEILLEKTPAFSIDYLYLLETPEDFSSEKLSELGSDLEYSNLPERTLCRVIAGPLIFLLSTGLLHRLQTVQLAVSAYDYAPYSTPKPDIHRDQLSTVTADDFEGLDQNIPLVEYRVTFLKPVMKIMLADHPRLDFESLHNLKNKRKSLRLLSPPGVSTADTPVLMLECECFDASFIKPLYPRRLVSVTCQLPTPPEHMFDSCHLKAVLKVANASGHLLVTSKKQMTVFMPCNLSLSHTQLLLPQCWTGPDSAHRSTKITADNMTVTCTKAQLLVITQILESVFKQDEDSMVFTTTLAHDAAKDKDMEYMEVCVEDVTFIHVLTPVTTVVSISLGMVQAFILERSEREIQPRQALVFSVPEISSDSPVNESSQKPLFCSIMQMPLDPAHQVHPPILIFELKEVRTCIDPLLWRWLHYHPDPVLLHHTMSLEEAAPISDTTYRSKRSRKPSTESGGGKRGAPLESVHSSSDHDRISAPVPQATLIDSSQRKPVSVDNSKNNSVLSDSSPAWWQEKMIHWFPVWHVAVLCGNISRTVMYVPTTSLSAVGARSIEDALEQCLKSDPQVEVLCLEFPTVTLQSTSKENVVRYISQYTQFPVSLPRNLWTQDKDSFPWSVKLGDFSCFSIQKKVKRHFLKPVSVNVTIGLSTKYKTDGPLSSLGLVVHIDTTPVMFSISREQLLLMSAIIINGFIDAKHVFGLIKSANNLEIKKSVQVAPSTPVVKESTSSSQKTPTTPAGLDLKDSAVDVKSSGNDIVKVTVLLQSTLERLKVCLYSKNKPGDVHNNLKLVFDIEDIMMSLDLQNVYMKLKCKVSSACVNHYKRHSEKGSWKPGEYLGLVLKSNDECGMNSGKETDEAGGFINITFTRASCSNVHGRWGARKRNSYFSQSRSSDKGSCTSLPQLSRWLNEIEIKLQAIDVVFSPVNLAPFISIVYPLPWVTGNVDIAPENNNKLLLSANSATLPLLYFDADTIRFIIPASELMNIRNIHDICMVQFDSISLKSQAENPLTRIMVRPDIYHDAERSQILHVPGSEVEDRQYQMDINGLSINSGTWQDFYSCLNVTSSTQHSSGTLRTMSENPALEWNNLMGGKESITPHVTLLPIMVRTDLCIIVAPAIVSHETLVCGISAEVNATSDIDVSLGMGQLLLSSALLLELLTLHETILKMAESCERYYPAEKCLTEKIKPSSIERDKVVDSGVEGDSSVSNEKLNIHLLREDATPSTSGYKDHSSFQQISRHESKLAPVQEIPKEKPEIGITGPVIVPVEILFTAGKITCVLYRILGKSNIFLEQVIEHWRDRKNLNVFELFSHGSEQHDIPDDMLPFGKEVKPLLYVLISQPHAFISRLSLSQKVQMSCFDFNVQIGAENENECEGIPLVKHFPVILLETKCGDPHPDTGVFPSFLTVTWNRSIGKSPKLEVELGRPLKIHISFPRWMHLIDIANEFKKIFNLQPYPEVVDLTKKLQESVISENTNELMTHLLFEKNDSTIPQEVIKEVSLQDNYRFSSSLLADFCFRTKQLLFSVEADDSAKLTVCLMAISCRITDSERLQSNIVNSEITLESVTATAYVNGCNRILLSPWSFTTNLSLQWDMWSRDLLSPQVRVVVNSDCLLINVGPEHLYCLYLIWKTYVPLLENLIENKDSKNKTEISCVQLHEQEQYYSDDLRTGAFQYVQGSLLSKEELPLPYQVVFWSSPPTMAWRYPQPRALTKVEVFPVPFKATSDSLKNNNKEVFCSLQYWNDCRSSFELFCTFQLSESEILNLTLPSTNHIVASTWRVKLITESSDILKKDVSPYFTVPPQALAACMRVDSFFSPSLIPHVQVDLTVSSLQLSLFNHMNSVYPMPSPLDNYVWDTLGPVSQEFMSVQFHAISSFFSSWHSGKSMLRVTSNAKSDIVDYAYLTNSCFIEPFSFSAVLSIVDIKEVTFISKPISVKFSPATAHTLGVSTLLWEQALKKYRDSVSDSYQVIITRYIICNDLMSTVRFGQVGTDENIPLAGRQCHFYSWRTQKAKPLLRFGIEDGAWIWSQPVPIDKDGIQICSLYDNEPSGFTLIIKVTHLSETQKKITIYGQLIISNLLTEHLDCVLVPQIEDGLRLQVGQYLVIPGHSSHASVLINSNSKVALRIKFQGLEGPWSGDIPLRGSTRSGLPWLVKVPLHDKGQFLSIWCRIIYQKVEESQTRILAIFCPLYMIKSYLPVPAKVIVETPGLNTQLTTIAKGRGEEHQLYCPGTIDHSHRLTFQLDNNIPPSNPYVPLSYTMVDQQKFFNCNQDEPLDIDNIVSSFFACKETCKWPFLEDRYNSVNFIAAEQPETNVHVKYESKGPYWCTLLVELHPWALFINTIDSQLSFIVEEEVICRTSYLEVVTPPKIEGTFHIRLNIKDDVFESEPLQLESPSETRSFYMPHISGLISLQGQTQVIVLCDNVIGYICVTSDVVKEIRVLNFCPRFTVCNCTSSELHIAALALSNTEKRQVADLNLDGYSLPCNVPIPIILFDVFGSVGVDLVQYILFNQGSGWGQPIKLTDCLSRQNFVIPCEDTELNNSAFVLTAQEKLGQMYINIYSDDSPQIKIFNKCNFELICAQSASEKDGIPVPESVHFGWWCTINAHSASYYNLPAYSQNFPLVGSGSVTPPLTFTVSDVDPVVWSMPLNILGSSEQFLRLPGHGEVKISIHMHCHTVYIYVESISSIEISAKVIRNRLSQDTKHFEDFDGASCSTYSVYETPAVSAESCDLNKSCDDTLSDESSLHIESKEKQTSDSDVNKLESPFWKVDSIIKGFNIMFLDEIKSENYKKIEVILLSFDDICVTLNPAVSANILKDTEVCISVRDFQFDNQLYVYGEYDFPVVFIRQSPFARNNSLFCFSTPIQEQIGKSRENAFVTFTVKLETATSHTAVKHFRVAINPLCAYVEDILISKLKDYFMNLLPHRVIFTSSTVPSSDFRLPTDVIRNSVQLAHPIHLRTLLIEPVSLLASIHTSIRLFIALDHSPLHFDKFERYRIVTTPYGLGRALALHYLYNAIFGAGWMVGSLELLGNPGGLARTVGTGLKDFVSLPYNGILESPWGFIIGITHGSASLLKHVTAGTLTSLTKLASSVARNLDRLTFDEEHLRRMEESRRRRPEGVRQGLIQGLTEFGMSILSAVGGVAHQPFQGILNEGISPRRLITDVGLGLVGVVTKPLSGAAGLVAKTGQGFLYGAGWSMMPQVRKAPAVELQSVMPNARLKFEWKFGDSSLLLALEATRATPPNNFDPVTLALTVSALFIIDTDNDTIQRVLAIEELLCLEDLADPTVLKFQIKASNETEEISRARIEEFVRCTAVSQDDENQSELDSTSSSNIDSISELPLTFYVNPQYRNFFLALFKLLKKQNQKRNFSLL